MLLAVIVDGKKEETFPDKKGHKYVGYVCNNDDVVLTWDNDNWRVTVTTNEPTVCTLKFETVNYFTDYLKSTGDLVTFTHEDTEQTGSNTSTDYRYVGANPNNYVKFNDELWRIIGVFNTDDGTDNYEERVKIIRATGLGLEKWGDYKIDTDKKNVSYDWKDTYLKNLLNDSDYYNCNGNYTKTCLKKESKSKITSVKWYLGSLTFENNSYLNTPKRYFNGERSTYVSQGKDISWVGEVGLIYPSDYGFATNESKCYDLEISYFNYQSDDIVKKACVVNNWMFAGNILAADTYALENTGTGTRSTNLWSITQQVQFKERTFFINGLGGIDYSGGVVVEMLFRPALYLKKDIATSSGDGSREHPYELS